MSGLFFCTFLLKCENCSSRRCHRSTHQSTFRQKSSFTSMIVDSLSQTPSVTTRIKKKKKSTCNITPVQLHTWINSFILFNHLVTITLRPKTNQHLSALYLPQTPCSLHISVLSTTPIERVVWWLYWF